MTNINCTENCVYQKDGKCTLDKVIPKTATPNSNCVYFVDS